MRETSINTYYQIIEEGLVGERQVLVLKYLMEHPNQTDVEMARGMGYADPNNVRPRRKELFDLGIIEDTGKRKCLITGRLAHQWGVVDDPDKESVRNKKLGKEVVKKTPWRF